MGRCLVVLNYLPKPVDAGQVFALPLIEPADGHVLAGDMVAREIDFQRRIAGIAAIGKTPHDLLQRLQRQSRHFLVPANVRYLFVITDRPQIMGVGDIAIAGVKLNETV